LTARLGDCYSYSELLERWQRTGAAMVQDLQYNTRLGSLPVSLRLTAEVLAKHDGALALWTSAALFADGLPEDLLQQLELSGAWPNARQWLARHHVLTRRDGQWHMLPPLARYALEASLTSDAGFDWAACRGPMQSLFEGAARQADSIASSIEALSARAWLMQNFGTLSRLMLHEVGVSLPDHTWLADMHNKLINHYQFQASTSQALLTVLIRNLRHPASALNALGDLDVRLGRPEEGRKHYDKALALFENTENVLGQATTLNALGILERRLGQLAKSRGLHDKALVLFERAQNVLGQANTLKALGDLEGRLGRPNEAHEHYDKALVFFEEKQSGLGQASTLLALGDLEGQQERTNEARERYNKALGLYKKEQSGLGQANTYLRLGDLEAQLGRPDEASRLHDKALVLFENEPDGLGQANTLQSMGNQLFKEGAFGDAESVYRQALTFYAHEKEPMGRTYAYAGLARCAHAQGNLQQRDEAMKNGLHSATAGHDSVRQNIMNVLLEITGGRAEAGAWLEIHMS
jgi:tetratricopeptide (TPR) repeat protein